MCNTTSWQKFPIRKATMRIELDDNHWISNSERYIELYGRIEFNPNMGYPIRTYDKILKQYYTHYNCPVEDTVLRKYDVYLATI